MKKQKDNVEGNKKEIELLKKEIELIKNNNSSNTNTEKINKNQQVLTDNIQNSPEYLTEFENLKNNAIKSAKENKNRLIITSITSIFTIPIAGIFVYFISKFLKIETFLEFSLNTTKIYYAIIILFFCLIETQEFIRLIKNLFINPTNLSDQTLYYLSLTAKEHILDPKGSVLREKYGTNHWSAVTTT